MATKVDDLIVEIKADTSQLRGSLKQVQGSLGRVGKSGAASAAAIGAGFASLRKGAIGLVGVFATLGITINKIAQVGMGFEDLKDSLDTVFGSIEAGDEAMRKIISFAQTTPFQIETATKAFIALKSAGIEPSMDMLQTFADTASVSVDQLGTFEALIRTVQRSASGGMGLEELNMISDRGIDVLGILRDELNLGKDDIAEFGKTAEGAALMVEALIKGLNQRFGGAMESKMDNLSTKASNMTIAFKGLADEIFKSGLGDQLKELTDRLTEFADAAARTIRVARGDATEDEMQAQIDALNRQIDRNIQGQNLLGLDEDPEDRNFIEKLLFGDKGVEQLRIYRNMLIEELAKMRETTSGGDGGGGDDKPAIGQEFVNFLDTFKKLAEDSADPLIEIKDQLGLIDQIAQDDALMEYFGASPELLEQVRQHLNDLHDEMDTTVTISDELKQTIINQSNAFTTDFVNSLMEGESALDSFNNFAKNIVSQIIATFLQMGVVNEILNSVFNLQGTNKLPTLDGNAGGGRVQAGRPTLVGERGAELFIPDSSGVVMNNMNTKGALGGGTPVIVNQSLNFSTGVVPTVRAEVTKMLPQIADVTKGAVLESAMRGGSYRRGLTGG